MHRFNTIPIKMFLTPKEIPARFSVNVDKIILDLTEGAKELDENNFEKE